MTAIQRVKDDGFKYVYHTTIKECQRKLGIRTTNEAIKKELKQMLDKKVWQPEYYENIKDSAKLLPSMMFIKEKTRPDGTFDKLKARIVAGGHRQDKLMYTADQISSPTVSMNSVFAVAAIAADEGREIATGDIPGAYLHADIEEDIYILINKEVTDILIKMDDSYLPFIRDDGTIVVKLLKALYGCVESARLWYEHLKAQLTSIGFVANKMDM